MYVSQPSITLDGNETVSDHPFVATGGKVAVVIEQMPHHRLVIWGEPDVLVAILTAATTAAERARTTTATPGDPATTDGVEVEG